MANNPVRMSKIRHILQLHHQGRSKLQIAAQTGIARNTLKKYLKQFTESKLTFHEISELSDKDLEELFVKPQEQPISEKLQTLFSLFPSIDKELKKKGMTRQLLWEQYKAVHPDGFGVSQFKHYYARWKAQVNPVMRMEHKAGDKLYVDFAGDKLSVVDPVSGEIKAVEVFVAILGASQLTYVEAVASQGKEDFIAACENAIHFCGGVPQAIVPDNLKSAVTKSSKYEPTLNETFLDFAQHYSTTILPARSYRPRDKALVENAVKIVYSRIYAKVRARVYHSLEQLNAAIKVALEEHNNAHLKGRNYSRRQQFEEVERAALMPLPPLRYELKKCLYATVAKNGHVALSADKHYYSVPYRFIGKKVKLLFSRHSVEIYYNYERIALHTRARLAYHYTTDKEHLASAHRFVAEWTPQKFISWAEAIHEDVKLYILKVLQRKQHPEQAYKSCVGILSFAKKIEKERLIKACQRALGYGAYNYKTIQTILEKELDKKDPSPETEQLSMPLHDNIRGEHYYQ
ncbi:IS21-like element ISFK1 family transposase [Flavisolibacter ginsenosidimutans]|uniref:IS21 family transposase n=2 Tax=Flavisolibacter ginsenosidimutans TaxID=661481 RepID=A0A5B8UE46_9BACT|nr:IS21 family transposase [Flavisolibacter ginsenosidimutans]QEC55302.1 IS21 family transposase [Flavisolibacter ginsenosidimutans]QEC56622.1 IS21 family transposase [Flavisolibacter ginsenosidimutans]